MGIEKQFTAQEAENLIERAGKAEVVDADKELSLREVLELAREVGIDPAFVERELLRERHPLTSRPSVDMAPEPTRRPSSRINVHEDPEYLVVTGDRTGWSRPIFARVGVWACVLGFISYFVVRSNFTVVSVLATAPFLAWATWSTLRLVGLTRERVSLILSRSAFAVRTVGPWSRRELSGDARSLQVDEPRMARDPEGGVEVFPLYFLRLHTNDGQLDILHGYQESELRRGYELIKAWRSRGGASAG
jgi:hypothetical protein